MKKLGPDVLRSYRGRILNTHPALLPKFGGAGCTASTFIAPFSKRGSLSQVHRSIG